MRAAISLGERIHWRKKAINSCSCLVSAMLSPQLLIWFFSIEPLCYAVNWLAVGIWLGLLFLTRVQETALDMVIHQSARLHESVADR